MGLNTPETFNKMSYLQHALVIYVVFISSGTKSSMNIYHRTICYIERYLLWQDITQSVFSMSRLYSQR